MLWHVHQNLHTNRGLNAGICICDPNRHDVCSSSHAASRCISYPIPEQNKAVGPQTTSRIVSKYERKASSYLRAGSSNYRATPGQNDNLEVPQVLSTSEKEAGTDLT